jgi:hypothetical protein
MYNNRILYGGMLFGRYSNLPISYNYLALLLVVVFLSKKSENSSMTGFDLQSIMNIISNCI